MKQQRGFTLIEVMIAVLISAILAVMAFESMQQALKNRDHVRASAARVKAVQFTMRSFVQDLSQLNPRPVREQVGPGYEPAISGGADLTFTRGGWTNPVGLERSSLQRVRYTLSDHKLYREYWLVLDAQLDPLPVSREVLDGVKNFSVRFMDDQRNWQDEWPPAAQNNAARSMRELARRPIAVEVTIELDDFGVLTRIVEVAG